MIHPLRPKSDHANNGRIKFGSNTLCPSTTHSSPLQISVSPPPAPSLARKARNSGNSVRLVTLFYRVEGLHHARDEGVYPPYSAGYGWTLSAFYLLLLGRVGCRFVFRGGWILRGRDSGGEVLTWWK